MLNEKPQEQHCVPTMLLVTKGIVHSRYPSCGFSHRFSTELLPDNLKKYDHTYMVSVDERILSFS